MKIDAAYFKDREEKPKRKARSLGNIRALMLTHERPGLLTETVNSFLSKTSGIPLTVFDDGSSSEDKEKELKAIQEQGIEVIRLPKMGFISAWEYVFSFVREKYPKNDCIVLEDDLSFATGWLDALKNMYEGTADLGYMPGAMSCLRVHDRPQNAYTVVLRGIEAYQVMWHSFQVNLLPWEVIENADMIWKAAEEAKKGQHGLDVYLLGRISDNMGRMNFVSMESWVAHEGSGQSLVESQGFRSLQHRGRNLVPELEKKVKDSSYSERKQVMCG